MAWDGHPMWLTIVQSPRRFKPHLTVNLSIVGDGQIQPPVLWQVHTQLNWFTLCGSSQTSKTSGFPPDMGQLHLCQLQLNYNYIWFYQLQLQLLLVACKNRYRIRNTIFCITVHLHWYIYCTRLNITVQSVVSMPISLVALNEHIQHKLLSAFINTQ